MDGSDQLGRIKGLLSQALGVANHNMKSNRSVDEAKSHIRQAIKNVDKASKSKSIKAQQTETDYQQWWGNVQAGVASVAASPMSAEANEKSLNELDKMIGDEETKLKELEALQNQGPDQLLQD